MSFLISLQKITSTGPFKDLLIQLHYFIDGEKQKAIEIQTRQIEAFCISDIELVRNLSLYSYKLASMEYDYKIQ